MLIPGVGHVRLGLSRRGVLFFAVFAFLLNAWLVAPLILPDPVLRWGLLSATVLLWLVSAVSFLKHAAEAELALVESREKP